jgi:hypothetical protein
MLNGRRVDNKLAPVDFICVDPAHVKRGRGVPDGCGALTINDRRWAYCSAARPHEPHRWKETGGLEFAAIRHADIPALPQPRQQ